MPYIAPFSQFCQFFYCFTPINPFSKPGPLHFWALVPFADYPLLFNSRRSSERRDLNFCLPSSCPSPAHFVFMLIQQFVHLLKRRLTFDVFLKKINDWRCRTFVHDNFFTVGNTFEFNGAVQSKRYFHHSLLIEETLPSFYTEGKAFLFRL